MPSIDSGAQKFSREKHFPQEWLAIAGEVLQLFHRYSYIYKPHSGSQWLSAEENWKLTDTEILKAFACAHPKFLLGCRAGRASRFAVLDIDAGSKYHNNRGLHSLLELLKQAGMKNTVLYRSSLSGGWHLYIFFDEPISSRDLRQQLLQLLQLNGFEINKGTLEVFPHPGEGSSGQGLRLPLQPGWAWLDKQSLEVLYERADLTPVKALEFFVDDMTAESNSHHDFHQLKETVKRFVDTREAVSVAMTPPRKTSDNVISIHRPPAIDRSPDLAAVQTTFQSTPTGIIPNVWVKGRDYFNRGLTGPSQRADAIYCLGHYLFYGDPSRSLPPLGYGYEYERTCAIKQILAVKHHGLSKDINRGRPEALNQVERAANWRPGGKRTSATVRYEPKRPISWVRENANRKIDARSRIRDALTTLRKRGRSFTTVDLQEAAKCSRRTLYVHADIWRSDYEDLAAGFFAICTDEYNVVEGAGGRETLPPPSPVEKIEPPGLLAARRIAYEISMRAQRERKEQERAVIQAQDASEIKWQAEVLSLIEKDPSELLLPELRALLAVSMALRARAPNEDGQTLVQKVIDRTWDCLSKAAENGSRLLHPP